MHRIDHQGEYFNLNAIHLCEPSPQRTPVLFQAGTSPKGQEFAGQHAECVFIGGNNAAHHARTVASLRAKALAQGRDPQALKVFGAITIIVAATDRQAQEKLQDYKSYGLIEGALALLSGWSGTDLSRLDLDAPPERGASNAIHSALATHGGTTVREWAQALTVGGAGPILVGSPTTVAQQLQEWFQSSDLDGFNLAYTVMPECVEDFVTWVVPQLQERGLYKRSYQAGTFREKLFQQQARLQEPHPAASYRRHPTA